MTSAEGRQKLAGWTFDVTTTGGTADTTSAMTDEKGNAEVRIDLTEATAEVTITETAKDTYRLDEIRCSDDTSGGRVGIRDGTSVSFEVQPGHLYTCKFKNSSLLPDPAEIMLSSMIDEDGDIETHDDLTQAEGWTFTATATGDPTLVAEAVTTDEDGSATLAMEFTSNDASGTVTLTQQGREGFEFLEGRCTSNDGDETESPWIEGAITLDVKPGMTYWCDVTNASTERPVVTPKPSGHPTPTERPMPLPTPPETDGLRPIASQASSNVFPLLLVLAASGVITSLAFSRRRR